tara:strand:+ start:63174 stop:63827 length:654 start_codon:yes stop_codon:yes gene_type:complete
LKASLKLIGGKSLKSPYGLSTRPTTSIVREAVINILRKDLNKCHWLDLCSGSGVMGCEALQMGARRVLSIELNKKTAQICKSNLISIASELSHKKCVEVISSEVNNILKKGCQKYSTKFLKEFPSEDPRFDFIYLDPPYKSGLYSLVLNNLLKGNWLKKNALVIYEFSERNIPSLPPEWFKQDKKLYGKTGLLLLTPNQASHSLYDTDSKQLQIVQE